MRRQAKLWPRSNLRLGSDSHHNRLNVILMETGIVFHSIIIGLTFVMARDPSFKILMVVIVFHQVFEGLALGARIAEIDDSSLLAKCIMAAVFAVIAPIGMGIGLGVLYQFNGNDPSVLWTLGTLNAFSAGILLWVGLVELMAHEWLHGDLREASSGVISANILALLAGMAAMSVLAKWA